MSRAIHHPSGFKPNYVWPNPAFPFREYFTHKKCRIFIIENIQHNWNWMAEWGESIRKTDYFFVYCGAFHDHEFATQAQGVFDALGLAKENFFFMFNSREEMKNFEPFMFKGALINHNAWLDENAVMRPKPETQKLFDAIYVGRRSAFKRHMLAEKVPRLALVAGINHGNNISPAPELPAYINESPLNPGEVCEKINQSHVGLILSEREGACFASSEYLLCGIPVVSTFSKGGRDIWYNEDNSIQCPPDAEAIADAVETLKSERVDPFHIRNMHIAQAALHRARFVKQLQNVFNRFGVVDISAEAYFIEHYEHKMRRSYRPDFASIFGSGAP